MINEILKPSDSTRKLLEESRRELKIEPLTIERIFLHIDMINTNRSKRRIKTFSPSCLAITLNARFTDSKEGRRDDAKFPRENRGFLQLCRRLRRISPLMKKKAAGKGVNGEAP